MKHRSGRIRELSAWGFDRYEYRPAQVAAHNVLERTVFEQSEILLERETDLIRDALAVQAKRLDLIAEMDGLRWSLGVIDFRCLIAFQRRLAFSSQLPSLAVPAADDWPALLALSFGEAKPVDCEVIYDDATRTVTLRSTNPNLHIRIAKNASCPLGIHAGGPFFEVASFRGRWFLRDGYHRAYAMLREGVFAVPAVIVVAQTLDELGANQPWFFPEDILFSATPPFVADFLHDDLVIEYNRPPLIKTLRITMEESLAPAPHRGEQS